MNFADRLTASIQKRKSYIVAGFDPRLDKIPTTFIEQAQKDASTNDEALRITLTSFYQGAAEALADRVAAVKPNLAFFEQFGLAGMHAYADICAKLRELDLPIIADAKRGDIGSTAEAYSQAFLGKPSFLGKPVSSFEADALTVNPFLGFDTLEVYLKNCIEHGKGIFVLVQTSNPGAKELQAMGSQGTVSEKVAKWVSTAGKDLIGECGFSSVGAVVGATYPEEAKRLRELMPQSFFLIPGMGSQGGSANDSVAGFGENSGGGIINLSRGLLSSFSSLELTPEQTALELQAKVDEFNSQIHNALE